MISPKFFYDTLASYGIDFYAGVPDSLLKNLCAYITDHALKHAGSADGRVCGAFAVKGFGQQAEHADVRDIRFQTG